MGNHVHHWVTSDGIYEDTFTAEQFDRRWLQSQRLDGGHTGIAYAGYTPLTVGREAVHIRYIGYVYEDTTSCPICGKTP